MHIFYTPNISERLELPEEESQHCVRVLRLTSGDKVRLTDGKGNFYNATITLPHPKKCGVCIDEIVPTPSPWSGEVHIAIAPTKNMDRIEWFTEKTIEMGIDSITFLKCRFSERKEIKTERIEKIAVSAMKQSLKAILPPISGMIDFKTFVSQPFEGEKYIAHCEEDVDKKTLKQIHIPHKNALILIGPEGDFSFEEVDLAHRMGYVSLSLGESRLRTETAGMVACNTLHIINE